MLRNCLKKGFRPAAVLVVAVLMCSLGGCSDSESGWLEGRAFTLTSSPRMNAGDSRISRFGFLFDTTKQEGRGR